MMERGADRRDDAPAPEAQWTIAGGKRAKASAPTGNGSPPEYWIAPAGAQENLECRRLISASTTTWSSARRIASLGSLMTCFQELMLMRTAGGVAEAIGGVDDRVNLLVSLGS